MKNPLGLMIVLFLAGCTGAAGPELTPIPFTVGSQQFKAGDGIVIDQVQATSVNPRVGDKVLVRGHYRLASATRASLGLFVTHKSPAGADHIARTQTIPVEGASGSFELACEIAYAGDIHVSFYPASGGESFGGVYFTAGAPKS